MKPATNSLERALALLELLEQTPGGLTNAEISRHLGIPKSTCSYIMTRLERKGYLLRDQTCGKPWRPHALSRTHRVREDRDIGRELPAHHLPRPQVLALVREQGLKRHTRTTITSRAGLLRELDLVRKQGYAISDREQSATVRAVAATDFKYPRIAEIGGAQNRPRFYALRIQHRPSSTSPKLSELKRCPVIKSLPHRDYRSRKALVRISTR
jgi:DNA-binding IclR family transcriptional regulator